MEANLATLPADVLYNISLALAGKNVNIKDKIENAKQIGRLCKTNKRFNNLYCKNDKIWKELYERDIGGELPKDNIRHHYLRLLEYVDEDVKWGITRGVNIWPNLIETLVNDPRMDRQDILKAYHLLEPNSPRLGYFEKILEKMQK